MGGGATGIGELGGNNGGSDGSDGTPAPAPIVTATASIVLNGFNAPEDFTPQHKEAFKFTLVASSEKIRQVIQNQHQHST